MTDNQQNISRHKHRRISPGIIIFCAIISMLSLSALSVQVGFLLSRTPDKSAERMARHYAVDIRSQFRAHINPNITLLRQISQSEEVARWLYNEAEVAPEAALRTAAHNEIRNFSALWPFANIHLVERTSLREFFFDAQNPPRDLVSTRQINAADPNDAWFFCEMRSIAAYSLCVGRCTRGTDNLYINISQRVYYQGENAGVVSVSISYFELFDLLSSDDVDHKQFYIINRTGNVMFDSSLRGLPTIHTVFELEEISSLSVAFTNVLMRLEGGVFLPGITPVVVGLTDGNFSYGSVLPIAGTDWLIVVLYGQRAAGISFIAIAGIILCLVITVVFLFLTIRLLSRHMSEKLEDVHHSLRTVNSKLHAVISNYSGIIWSVDAGERITNFNGLILSNLGMQSGYYEGKQLSELPANWHNFNIAENARQTFRSGPMRRVFHVGDDVFSIRTAPVFDSSGNITDVVGSMDDITESFRLQKKLEEALNAANAANKVKSNFLSTISHEMRTQMNTIIGISAIGKKSSDIHRKEYAFEKIIITGNHLLGVINDVLDMSKIEAGMFTISNEPFKLKKTINKVASMLHFRIDEKKQHFEFEIADDVPAIIIADDQRLTQVLTNLIFNAIKFTPEGKTIRLKIKLAEQQEKDCVIQFDVIDQGIGLSFEQQGNLFQSFVQAEASTSRKYGGTDLGLAISKHIVELIGGRIWVKSELGRGAVFSFTMKVGLPDESDVIALQTEESETAVNYVFPGKRILVADDVEINIEIMQSILEESGLIIDSAENGQQAFRLFAENPDRYDLIFMDLHMPIMNGYEATRSIRALSNPYAKYVPIIALTADVFREDIEKCLKAGMNGHVGKPFDFQVILGILNQYLLAQE